MNQYLTDWKLNKLLCVSGGHKLLRPACIRWTTSVEGGSKSVRFEDSVSRTEDSCMVSCLWLHSSIFRNYVVMCWEERDRMLLPACTPRLSPSLSDSIRKLGRKTDSGMVFPSLARHISFRSGPIGCQQQHCSDWQLVGIAERETRLKQYRPMYLTRNTHSSYPEAGVITLPCRLETVYWSFF